MATTATKSQPPPHVSPKIRPCIKIPGGKFYLARRIVSLMPRSMYLYIEPFFGGGNVFFALHPSRFARAYAIEKDADRAHLYQSLRDHGTFNAILSVLKAQPYHRDTFAKWLQMQTPDPTFRVGRARRIQVITRYSNPSANLRTQLKRIIKRAG